MSNQPNNPNRSQTVATLIGALAAMITALTGVGVFLYQMGIIDIPKSGDRSKIYKPEIVEPVGSSLAPRSEQPLETDGNQAASSNTPLPKLISGSSRMDGVWDLKITTTKKIAQDGFIEESSEFSHSVIRFKSASNLIEGEVIGIKGSYKSCSEAIINGTVNQSNVSFTWQSQGSCCSGEKMKFTGNLSEDGNLLIGKYEPVGIPTTNCTLFWANLVGNKRTQN